MFFNPTFAIYAHVEEFVTGSSNGHVFPSVQGMWTQKNAESSISDDGFIGAVDDVVGDSWDRALYVVPKATNKEGVNRRQYGRTVRYFERCLAVLPAIDM